MRTVKSTNTNTSTFDSSEKPKHYVNVYKDGIQVGYMVVDKQPKLVTKAQADDDYMNRFMKHSTTSYAYRELGSTSREMDLDDI